MEINLPFDSSEKSIELIKLSALYYDKVNILCPEFRNDDNVNYADVRLRLYSQNLLRDLNILETNSIVAIKTPNVVNHFNDDMFKEPFAKEIISGGECSIEDIDSLSKITITDTQLLDGYEKLKGDGLNEFLKEAFADDNEIDVSNPEDLKKFSAVLLGMAQLSLAYEIICSNQNIMVNNGLVSRCISTIYKNNNEELTKLKRTPKELIAFDAIPIFLPSFYQMSFDDIVDLRYLAKDELQEMRHYIDNLSIEYSPDDKKLVNPKSYLRNKIKPSIDQLESKVYGLKSGTIQRALQGLKDPKTYTPLLTTFFTDIPTHISLAVSMGLIAAEAGVEYLKQKKELETNPLYFSVKLKNIVHNKLGL